MQKKKTKKKSKKQKQKKKPKMIKLLPSSDDYTLKSMGG